MKYLSAAQKARNIRHAAYEVKRKKRNKERKEKRRENIGHYEEVRLVVPGNFDLDVNVGQALTFFAQLRQTILTENKKGIIHMG
ncbi:MAG: hypothetical protein OXC91_14995 [Rhodobacteraceae bacterium]|nr:hypothetical protein [Paracoccaceae bacterium]